MAEIIPDSKIDEKKHNRQINAFIRGLSTEQKMLIVLKTQLYDGSWKLMSEDLKNRLAGKPYIFKLVNRINDDIERIKGMHEFEEHYKINLADYVDSVE